MARKAVGDAGDARGGDAEHGEADGGLGRGGGAVAAMAVMAAAAWARTVRVMRLRPAMSATGCIMVMSETPT